MSRGRRVVDGRSATTHGSVIVRRDAACCRSLPASSFYYAGTGESPLTLRLMRLIDEQFLETPSTARGRSNEGLIARPPSVRDMVLSSYSWDERFDLMRLLGVHALLRSGPRTCGPRRTTAQPVSHATTPSFTARIRPRRSRWRTPIRGVSSRAVTVVSPAWARTSACRTWMN